MKRQGITTDLLKEIRSVRKFNDEPIPKEVLEDIIDCARLSPSARNLQPWEFIIITDKDKLEQLAGFHKSASFIKNAAASILVFSDTEKGSYFLEDGCAATQIIIVAAKLHGLDSCWVAGAKGLYEGDDMTLCEGLPCHPVPQHIQEAEEVSKILNVPSNFALISIVALGYSDEKPEVDKRSLSDVLHWQQF